MDDKNNRRKYKRNYAHSRDKVIIFEMENGYFTSIAKTHISILTGRLLLPLVRRLCMNDSIHI
jgi:hypothetical protein